MLLGSCILDNAETITEEFADRKKLGHLEGASGFGQAGDTVEGLDMKGIVLGISGQHIPATLENLHGVWFHVAI